MDDQLTYYEAAETVVMKPFKEFITELFDKPARWKKIKDGPDEYVYKSDINGKDLTVIIEEFAAEWEALFKVDGSMDITGTGNEVKVFSTVLDIISDFINSEEPDIIIFSASKSQSSSRSNLYDRLVKRFAKTRGYTSTSHNTTVNGERAIQYTLEK